MTKCLCCGSIGSNSRVCGVCGRHLAIVDSESSQTLYADPGIRGDVSSNLRGSGRFWTATKIVALTIAVLVTISSVAAGVYYDPTRMSSPSCANGAVNYASCDSCGSTAAYDLSRQACFCTDGATNPPSCNHYCANNAINPPSCDRCPDNRTDVFCPGQAPEAIYPETPARQLDA